MLHTLPPPKFQGSIIEAPPTNPDAAETADLNAGAATTAEKTLTEPPKKRQKMDTTANTIPRLISVVEIVKREFLVSATRPKTSTAPPVMP